MILACYSLLLLITVVIAFMTWLNWRRFGGIEHLGIGALLYYYSLYGAWTVLSLKTNGGHSDALEHLEQVLFPVRVDGNYFLTIAMYGLFDVLVLAGIQLMPKRSLPKAAIWRILQQPHPAPTLGLMLLALAALLGSASALWAEIMTALEQGVPIYLFTRAEPSPLFTIHQLLNRVGLAALACAWPLQILVAMPMWRRMVAMLALVPLTAIWLGYLGMLGNRNELVVAVLAGLYLLTALGGRVRWVQIVAVMFSAFLLLRSIETLRSVPLEQMFSVFLESVFDPEFWNPSAVAGGSESLAAHLSMYGVLSADLPWTWGSSLLYLVQSLVPMLPAASRVPDSYAVYASGVGAPDGQGFNIHFAAGAYLNLGVLGVIMAASLLALLLWGLRCWSLRMVNGNHTGLVLPSMVGYAFLCAFLPIAMRGGPEGLKALFFEGYLIPFLVAALALRLTWKPRRLQLDGKNVMETT